MSEATIREKLTRWPSPEEVEFRAGPKTKKGDKRQVLPYVDARFVMEVLDDAFGLFGWGDSYRVEGNRLVCRLDLNNGGDHSTHREDGVEIDTDEPREGGGDDDKKGSRGMDNMKTAVSESFKRAGAKLGIARCLYSLPKKWIPADFNFYDDKEVAKLREWYASCIDADAAPVSEKTTAPISSRTGSFVMSESADNGGTSGRGEKTESDGPYPFLPDEDREFLDTKLGFGNKQLEDGTKAGDASFLKLIESTIGRSFLGWVREKMEVSKKDKEGKARKPEWIANDEEKKANAGRALEIWHKIEAYEKENEKPLPVRVGAKTAGKRTAARTEQPDFEDQATCEEYADIPMTDGDHKGKTLRAIVEEDREWVEQVYIQEGSLIAAVALGYDFDASLGYAKKGKNDAEKRKSREEWVETHKKKAAKKIGGMFKGKVKGAPTEDEKLTLFLSEVEGAAKENGVSMDEIRETVKDTMDKTLEELSQDERNELLKELGVG